MNTSTIAAIATPIGSGGIGIIKISGSDACNIADSIFKKSSDNSNKLSDLDSHRLYHGHIINPENMRIIDEVLIVFMRAPRTYTREDVVEIHAHSGTAVLRSILNLVLKYGAILAQPGEFTKRAFMNGRIDLTQAEGIIDVINAKTDQSLKLASSQIIGEMRHKIESIRTSMVQILAQTEAAIDFPDDVDEGIDIEKALDFIKIVLINPLKNLIKNYEDAHILRDGLKVIVAGKPNVGKSSLMNRLIKKQRSIVTAIPGTTRDIIEENLIIKGVSIILTDTAGLHITNDPVEQIGIERAYEHIYNADLILFMTDASQPLTDEDFNIYKKIYHKPLLWIANKMDMVNNKSDIEHPEDWEKIPCIKLSAKYDKTMAPLKDLIASTALKESLECESSIIPNLRHKQAIEQSLKSLHTALDGIEQGMPFELINIDIQEAMDLLGQIIGLTVKEDILEHIFNNFCIGK